ncbi:efflux transporter outer membrane subunit [Telmatobacter sp. DSM 110680]|uniref:Efflux transporter outer membrane subunit n=1 Tax=Telmatobacter sp. DSM 110680 TaxID=3036704 RepID=A0AAU7DMK1_9BACT
MSTSPPQKHGGAIAPKERMLRAALLGLVALLSACKVGPNFHRPDLPPPPEYKGTGSTGAVVPPPNPQAGTWKSASPSDGMLRGKWWEIYQDPQLNALEEQIAPQNQNLRAAMEAYLSARDQVRVARADFYPTLSVSPATSRDQVSSHRPLIVSSTNTGYSDFQLEGQASWEPDLWGRVRRSVEAAHENAQASAADLANLDLSLHAELALDYFELRGLDSDARLLEQTVNDYQHQLDLNQQLVKGGIATEVVVAQAQALLETTRAQLVDVKQGRNQYEHAIATLMNKEAREVTLTPAPLVMTLPQVPVGVPSQLVERRPDIAAAERRAAAANAQIGIAISAFYPSVTLGGGGGFESTNVGTLIQGPSALWSLGAQATELLFDAGRRHALTDQAKHNYESQASTYRATVLGAFNEVEDRLSDLKVLEDEATTEQRAVAAAQHSLDLSNQRYKGGATNYLEVLVAEGTLLSNQRTSTDLITRQYVASVGLVRALGGGWDMTQLPH